MKSPQPPRAADRLLAVFCAPHLLEAVQGDLHEEFDFQVQKLGERRARWWYWREVLGFLKPFALKRKPTHYRNPTHTAMMQTYFKIAWRNLVNQKLHSSIKIGGLATGIAACLLIALYIRQEVSYDRHYAQRDRIYRLIEFSSFRGQAGAGVHFPAPLAGALRTEYPDFEKVGHYNAVELFGAGSQEVRRSDHPESRHEKGFVYASQELLDILEVPFLYGDREQALTEPNTMVMTKRKADAYFPGQNPIGKLLILNNDAQRQYRVSGVIRDFPATSHFQYDFLMTLAGKEFGPGEQTNWRNSNYINYVRVRPGTDIGQLEQKLARVVKKYFMPAASREGANSEEMAWLRSFRFHLQPVGAIYLNEDRVQDGLQHGDVRYIGLFGAIAAFILLIAAINFINLSTATSTNRAKEVGVRKVIGSQRGSLIQQFLTESLLFSSLAVVLGLLLANVFLPYFNDLVAKTLVFPWREWGLFPVLVGGALLTGLLAGLYPAFYLSAFQPMQVLKGTVSRGSKHATTRSVLVVFQFTVSIVLLVGTLTIARQMHYILTKKVGFDKEQVLLLQGAHTLANKLPAFKNELLRLPDVKQVSVSSFLPVEGTKRNNGGTWLPGMPDDEKVSTQHWDVDEAYVKTLGLTLRLGRNFSARMPTDSQAVIINESLAKALRLRKPIGQRIFNWRGGWTVIGVVEDFHFNSLKEKIQPMGLYLGRAGRSSNTVLVKVNTRDMATTLESVTNVWKAFSPYQPIRYNFLDEKYASMYEDVQRTQRIFSSFAGLAILVACLGLFALAAFMAEQRRKEMSIRKVLGASLNSLVGLLVANFIKLVLISFGLAVPIGWYLMSNWLEDFAYRISLSWELFLVAGLSTVVIALLTVSFQSIKAALTNPVKSLRSE